MCKINPRMECMCSICLDSLFSVNTDVSVTPCGHLYHKSCLEGWMQNNLQCPNCKTEIRTGLVKKIHPDVFDELVYSDCSIETANFLEEVYMYEKEKRMSMLNIVKKLDKENTSLRKTNKTNQAILKTSKLFFKEFQTDNKKWQENIQKLKLENITLLAEIKNLNNDKEVVNNLSEESKVEFEKKIEKNNRNGSFLKTLAGTCLQIFSYLNKKTLHLGFNRDEGNHNDYKDNILQTLDDNLISFSNKKRVYKGISDEVQKQLKEFDENDNKINGLLLKKINELEHENKLLMKTSKSSQTDLKSIETRLRSAQIDTKNLKESYKMLQEENKDLLAKLENTKEMVEDIEANLPKELHRMKRKIRDENCTNKNHCSDKVITHEGLLIIYKSLRILNFLKYVFF